MRKTTPNREKHQEATWPPTSLLPGVDKMPHRRVTITTTITMTTPIVTTMAISLTITIAIPIFIMSPTGG